MAHIKGIILQQPHDETDATFLDQLLRHDEINRLFLRSPKVSPGLKAYTRTKDVKVLRYINEGDLFSEIFASRSDTNEYAKDCVETCLKDGFHGLLFDWPAPGFNHSKRQDSERAIADPLNYLGFLKVLRSKIAHHPELQGLEIGLTIPVAQPHVRRISTVIEDMKRLVSYFVLANWDLNATSTTSVHASKLYGPNLCVESALASFNRIGLFNTNIVVGIPLYGIYYTDCELLGERYTNATPASPEIMELVRCLPETDLQRDVLSGNLPLYQDTIARKLYTFEDRLSFETKQNYILEKSLGGWIAMARDSMSSDRTMLSTFSNLAPLHVILAEPVPQRTASKKDVISSAAPPVVKPVVATDSPPMPPIALPPVVATYDMNIASPSPIIPLNVPGLEEEVASPVSPTATDLFPDLLPLPTTSNTSLTPKCSVASVLSLKSVSKMSSQPPQFRPTDQHQVITSWEPWESYREGDVVHYGKSLFICKASHGPVTPRFSSQWQDYSTSSSVDDKNTAQIQEKVGENHHYQEHLQA